MSPTGAILPRLVRPHHLKFVSGPSKSFLEQVYEVESIRDHRGPPGNRQYLVRWEGFTSADDSWEPESNIYTDECIREYWNSKPINTAVRSDSALAVATNPANSLLSVAALPTEFYQGDISPSESSIDEDTGYRPRRRVRLTHDERLRVVTEWNRVYRP